MNRSKHRSYRWNRASYKAVLVSTVAMALGTASIESNGNYYQCLREGAQCRQEADAQKSACQEEARAQARAAEEQRTATRNACTASTEECNSEYNQAKADIIQQLEWEMQYCDNRYNYAFGQCRGEFDDCTSN
jgi:hypothetical protein